MEVIWFFANPCQKPSDLWVSAKAFDIGKMVGKLRFGEARMDSAMANLMQPCGAEMSATFQPRHQMMPTSTTSWRDWPFT